MVNPITTAARRITRAVNTLAGADGNAYFDAAGLYLGADAAGTAPTQWTYAVATQSVISQQTAQAVIDATDDPQTDLDGWFDTHRDVLSYVPAVVDRRRQ